MAVLGRGIRTIQDVVDWNLCVGCGACAYVCGHGGVSLEQILSVGIRARFNSAQCATCAQCLPICPGYQVKSEGNGAHLPKVTEADHELGPALEIWEGYAADPEVRYKASSGGILSALALYCLEKEGMGFVLHTAMDEAEPWKNRTVQSRTRAEVLSRTGSRYAPSSPCEGLGAIEESRSPCVFIGKPCDTAAVMALARERPQLADRIGLVMTFFCAGTPSAQGTLDLAKALGFGQGEIGEIRYRGEGWPGVFKVRSKSGERESTLSYRDSWGSLTRYRSLRCHLCPDGLGRVADLSCGDAWESEGGETDLGRSIVIVRTKRGQELLRRARDAKYVELSPVQASRVLVAQKHLLVRRRELFGRLAAMRLLFIPTPRFVGFSLFRSWSHLSYTKQVKTLLGTLVRLIQRGLWRKRPRYRPAR